MFAVYCKDCRKRMLLSLDDIAVRNTPTGIAVDYRCLSSHRGTWLPRKHASRPVETI